MAVDEYYEYLVVVVVGEVVTDGWHVRRHLRQELHRDVDG